MDRNLKELFAAYKRWVQINPNLVTDVETLVTWSSFFIAGKINKSPIATELVYSASKLLTFFNDRLIREAYGNQTQYYGLRQQLKLYLTIIHFFEVFAELIARHKWGMHGKWTFVSLLQLFKCSSALILLYRYKEVPLSHPPIPLLQRNKFVKDNQTDGSENSWFTLQRSGRVIRRVDGSPPVAFRDWQPVKGLDEKQILSDSEKDLQTAEALHILKPLIHLGSMRVFGMKSWKQWLVALSLDIASAKLYNRHVAKLSNDQRLEINRRKLNLVLYLIRTPMYSRYTKKMIENFLIAMSKNIPMTSFIFTPIMQYLNHWQGLYFYTWSL